MGGVLNLKMRHACTEEELSFQSRVVVVSSSQPVFVGRARRPDVRPGLRTQADCGERRSDTRCCEEIVTGYDFFAVRSFYHTHAAIQVKNALMIGVLAWV